MPIPLCVLCRYTIDRRTDMDRVFNIHAGNGSVFTLRELDREANAWHNISVIATEFSKCRQQDGQQTVLFTYAVSSHSVSQIGFLEVTGVYGWWSEVFVFSPWVALVQYKFEKPENWAINLAFIHFFSISFHKCVIYFNKCVCFAAGFYFTCSL